MIIYAFIAILILSLLSAFVSWVVNKKMKMKMLDFKEINSKLLIVIFLINFIIIFSSGNVCKKLDLIMNLYKVWGFCYVSIHFFLLCL